MRAQSHVVGVALMLGLATIALGALTVGVGGLLDAQAASADAERVATDFDEGLQAVERTGHHSHDVAFTEGRLGTESRTLRLIRNGSVVESHNVDALVFESGDRRVAAVAGAVIRGTEGNAWLVSEPPISESERSGVLVVGAPVLGTDHVAVSGENGQATLRTNISHTDTELGRGRYAVTIETATPGPLERHLEAQNATTERRTFAGDDHSSVVARYPGTREGYLVVHNINLEVTDE